MAAASSNGEADELIEEVARSEVNEMGNAMATASGGGETSEPIDEATKDDEPKKKGRRRAKGAVKQRQSRGARQREERRGKETATATDGG